MRQGERCRRELAHRQRKPCIIVQFWVDAENCLPSMGTVHGKSRISAGIFLDTFTWFVPRSMLRNMDCIIGLGYSIALCTCMYHIPRAARLLAPNSKQPARYGPLTAQTLKCGECGGARKHIHKGGRLEDVIFTLSYIHIYQLSH